MFKKVILLLITLFCVILLVLYDRRDIDYKEYVLIDFGDITLRAEVAQTEADRIKGLSNRESLGENEALLFIFDREDYYGIWMKDMKFPIDIAWLDKNKRIIYIENNVSPDTFPEVFFPTNNQFGVPALFVIETNANFFLKNNIKVGDVLNF